MFPSHILRSAVGTAVSVELKNGECYNGLLTASDANMNFTLDDVTVTSADGSRFWKMENLLIRGTSVKSLRFDDSFVPSRHMKNARAQ